jgi:hypothetical protein
MDSVPQNPRLSQDRWQALLDTGIAEMEKLLARYEADGASFLDSNPKQLLPGLHYLGNQGPRAVYCLSTAKGLFLFDAPGGPSLVDFLNESFRKLGFQERKLTAVLLTSGDEEATTGLEALVQHTGCQVVASRAGLESIQRRCPADARVIAEEDLERSGWFPVSVIPLGGRGVFPVAYELRWAEKRVLLSGRIPVKPSPEAAERLQFEVGTRGSAAEYLKSLDRLAKVSPNLWLPAVPVQGQNANLYDQDWMKVLAQNRQFFSW